MLSKNELSNLHLSEIEKKLIKPLYKNSDIYKYYTKNNPKIFLINIRYTDRPNLDLYPNIKNHLLKYKNMLSNRPQT
jgi:adenine-specific DNA-methyltransferase